MKTFSIAPSTNMMTVLGNSGYTFDFAIADIIDNSIAAHAKNITILFDFNNEKPYLYILDDGEGMRQRDLHTCMILAYKSIDEIREEDDLGRFSLGLKSASKSFCHKLFVCSKTKTSKACTVELDFDYIVEKGRWDAFELDDFNYSKEIKDHGTLVLWEDLKIEKSSIRIDNNAMYDIFEKLEESLSHIFGKYIIEDGLNIYIKTPKSQKNIIKGWNPFKLPSNGTTSVISTRNLEFNDKNIFVQSYILPTYSKLNKEDQKYFEGKGLIEQQGFYIYRNKRLIQEGGWLDLEGIKEDHKCIYARIEVNIGTSLDNEFSVNYSKNKVIVPRELQHDFIEIAKFARMNSKKNYDYMKNPNNKSKRSKKDSNITVWSTKKVNGNLVLNINTEHPIIKEVFSKLSKLEIKKITNLLTKTLPISMIQSQGGFEEQYEEKDIQELIKETYESMIVEKDLQSIKKELFKTEPFSFYIDELISFFEKLEEK